jgi:uncharacterized repeat protein (TIGR01451 family)
MTAAGNNNLFSRVRNSVSVIPPNGVTITGSNTNTTHNISVVTYLPPEQTGTRYVFAKGIDKQATDGSLDWDCENNFNGTQTSAQTTMSVTGTAACYRLNLVACRYLIGDSTDNTNWRFHYTIFNYSDSGIPLNELKLRYWFYDDGYTNWNVGFAPGGFRYDENGNPVDTTVQTAPANMVTFTPTKDCGSSRTANSYYEPAFSSTRPLPGGGGYFSTWNQDPAQYYRNLNPDISDVSNDFTRITDFNTCTNSGGGTKVLASSITTNSQYLTLMYQLTPVCEYTNSTTLDSNSGTIPCETPCGASSYCGAVVPTATPAIVLTKTIDKTVATIGETISYSINYTNSSTYEINPLIIWDTIPGVTDFIDGGAGFTTTNFSGTIVVSWSIANVAASASGSKCFIVRVARYPYNIFGQQYYLGLITGEEYEDFFYKAMDLRRKTEEKIYRNIFLLNMAEKL